MELLLSCDNWEAAVDRKLCKLCVDFKRVFCFYIYFVGLLIGVEGARLLQDKRSGETLKGAKRQVAHRLPRKKRAAWNGNQLLSRTSLAFRNRELPLSKAFKGKKLANKHKLKIQLDKFMGQSLYFIRLSFIRDILREV
ncbi:MAG: hypothetical protein ACQET8_19755 [Bacillota bacterium]